jgi:hypothetical protein
VVNIVCTGVFVCRSHRWACRGPGLRHRPMLHASTNADDDVHRYYEAEDRDSVSAWAVARSCWGTPARVQEEQDAMPRQRGRVRNWAAIVCQRMVAAA